MMIETAIALGTLCVKAVEFVVGLSSTTSAVKDKCEDLAGSVKILQAILRRYSPAAANDEAMAEALSELETALCHAEKVVRSCDRHAHGGPVGWAFSAVRAREDLARLVAADERICKYINYFKLAAPARRVHRPGVARQQQPTTVIHNHHYSFRAENMNFLLHQGGGAMASSGGGGSRIQMPMQQLAMASSPRLALVDVPASPRQRRPTEMMTTAAAAAATRTTHASPAASSSAVASRRHRGAPSGPATTTSNAAAASSSAIVASSSSSSATRRQLVIGDGASLQRRDDGLAALAHDGPPTRSASRATRTPAPTSARAAPSAPPPPPPPPPPVAPPLRRSNTSSSRIRPPREPRAPRELDSGGHPQQRATARPSRR